jgi:hypothetical protein
MDVFKLPTRQQKILDKLQRKETFDLPTRNFARKNSKKSQVDDSDSSEEELNDNND